MIDNSDSSIDETLAHPTTLNIFLHLRKEGEVGVRETQRACGLKSHSTALWHLNKLMDAKLVTKTPANLYSLTDLGKNTIQISIKTKQEVILYKNYVLFKNYQLLSFIISTIVLGILMIIGDVKPLIREIYFLLSLVFLLLSVVISSVRYNLNNKTT